MASYKPHYHYLKEKWIQRHRSLSQNLWQKHKDSLSWLSERTKHVAAGSLASAILLTSPAAKALSTPPATHAQDELGKELDPGIFLVGDLSKILPQEVRPLTPLEEQEVSDVLSKAYGFSVSAEMEGKRLNRSYGYIGAEQHLARFPGDTMGTHFDNPDDAKEYWSSGMAPGLGAFGYFAPSAVEFSQKDKLREKYYIAVQTFLSPDFNSRFAEYRDFYKFRKMLVVNPNNGRAIVTVIGDAGPAQWTGKSLGGSPEVMQYLERVDGKGRGSVLYFFIDDPEDQVPLGPIEYNNTE